MFPIELDEIDKLCADDIETLIELDSKGIILSPGQTIDDYKDRLKIMYKNYRDLEKDLDKGDDVEFIDGILLNKCERIPVEVMDEGAEITEKEYGFSVNWVPGFFLSQNLGMLWGGCAISFPDDFLSIFLIRSSFENSSKWFIYSRKELTSHESCHVARIPLKDMPYEEHFAYRLSSSALRRYMGNCFQTSWDAILFILPVFILLAAQIILTFSNWSYPIWPFWIFAALYPGFLLLRNHLFRRHYFMAERNLRKLGNVSNPAAVLFRTVTSEIVEISKLKNSALSYWLDRKIEEELRWKVISIKFIKGKNG